MPGTGLAPILTVDDDAETRRLLERLLAISGYRTIATGDAMHALRLCRAADRPALVILDLDLAGIDGRGLVVDLRGDPRLAGLPVIVYSAHPRPVVGVSTVVRKGWDDPEVLFAAIATCLAESRTG